MPRKIVKFVVRTGGAKKRKANFFYGATSEYEISNRGFSCFLRKYCNFLKNLYR